MIEIDKNKELDILLNKEVNISNKTLNLILRHMILDNKSKGEKK